MRRTCLKRLALASVVSVMGAGILVSGEAAALCPAEFPAPGFERQLAITVTNPAASRGDTLVLATVDTSSRIANGLMRADGGDIRVATSECASVPFWIEGGLGTPATKIWMRLPKVAAGGQQIDLYYGAAGASSVSSRDSVFGPGLLSLYTFTEQGGMSLGDRAGASSMTLAGTSWSPGPLPSVGAITSFSDGRLKIATGGPTLATDFTVLTMVKPSVITDKTSGIFGNYRADDKTGWGLKLQGKRGQFTLITNETGNGIWCQDLGGGVVPDAWQFIGARRQLGSLTTSTLFQDGARVHTLCPGDNRNVNGAGPFELGRQYDGGFPFAGEISLTLLYGRALPDAEIAALDSALRMTDPPSVTRIGTPPAAPKVGTVTSTGTTALVDLSTPADVGDGPVEHYDVRCSPSGQASSGFGPITVTGLTAGKLHTCAVRAANAFGVGPWSVPSTPFDVDGAPSFGNPAVAKFVVRTNGSFPIIAAGLPVPTVTLTGTLPAGLAFANGVIGGTPASGSVGVYPLTLTAENGILPDATQSLDLQVTKAPQTITFPTFENRSLGENDVTILAASSSGLPLTFTVNTPGICSVTGKDIRLLAAGVCTINASQPGDVDFEAARPIAKSFQIFDPFAPDGSAPDGSSSQPTIDAGSSSSGATSDSLADAIQGSGCQCDAAGGSGGASGLLFGALGLGVGIARRARRQRK